MDKEARDMWISQHWREAECGGHGQDYIHAPDGYLFAGKCQHLSGMAARVQTVAERFDKLFRDHPRQTLENYDHTRHGASDALARVRFIKHEWSIGAIIQGPKGTGKSHLAKGLVFAAIEVEKTPFWVSAVWLAKLFRDSQGYEHDAKDAREMLARALGSDLLVVDDVGSQRKTDSGVWEEQLTQLVDQYRGVLIITTNLAGHDLIAAVGGKAYSRIAAKCGKIETSGKDFRVEHKAAFPKDIGAPA